MLRPAQMIRRLGRLIKSLIPFAFRKFLYERSKRFRKKHRAIKVTYYPAFISTAAFTDQYWRIIWYLSLMGGGLERVLIPFQGPKPTPGKVPDYFDPAVASYEQSLHHKIDFVSVTDSQSLLDEYASSDAIIVWQHDLHRKLPDGLGREMVTQRRKFFVDNQTERYESGNYLDIPYKLIDDHQEILELSKQRLDRLALELRDRRIGYLFGTGPNLYQALDRNFDDGYSIICNSMIKNIPLLERLQPKILTMADPVFHAGISKYAGEFRRHLAKALDDYHLQLVVPLRHYRVYERFLGKELSSQLIGLPDLRGSEPNLDLRKEFGVIEAHNVLTLMMLPLGCTFFDTLYTLGFDGRPLKENDYFWKHDPQSQLVDEMADAKKAHPSFFDIDYNAYYQQHLTTLEKWVDAAENQGHKIINLSASYIPVLNERSFDTSSSTQ
jgi:hypothetical protein